MSSIVGPDGARCQTNVSGQPTNVNADGGTVAVTVNAARDCTWSASSEPPWMQLSATSGQGNASLTVTVARNEQPLSRSGAVVVNDQRLMVSQEARPCTFELRGSSDHLSSAGGRSSIEVSTLNDCAWTATTGASWIRILTPSGTGSGAVQYEASPNAGAAREASITIGNRQYTVVQDAVGVDPTPPPPLAPTCAPALSTQSVEIAQGGQSASVILTINGACDWTAAAGPSDAWLNVSPASGRGNGTVTLRAERNDGAARTATVTIAQLLVTVTQPGSCAVTIGSSSESYGPGGGRGTIRVDTAGGCRWTASSDRPEWATMTQASGEGGGEARYTVAANASTSSRTAVITVGSSRHTVTQRGCAFDVAPPTRSLPAQGGGGSVQVRPDAPSCTWSVSGAISGMTVTPASGTGEGNFSYSVPANPDPASRTIRLRVGNDTHVITQDGTPAPTPCTYQLDPGALTIPVGGGGGTVRVNASPQGCTGTWLVNGAADWTTITGGSGSGSGEFSFSYTVPPNLTGSSRSVTLTVGTQTHVITQEGPAPAPTCTYQLAPGALTIPVGGGGGTVRVNASPQGCTGTWLVNGAADWTTITGGSGSGSGEFSFSYTVPPNLTGSSRSVTLTVGTQTHVITQEGPAPTPTCAYQLESGSRHFPHGGGPGSVGVTGTPPGCAGTWSVSAGVPDWVQVGNGSGAGAGSGQFSYTVAQNMGTGLRTATLSVANQSYQITQDGAPAPTPSCTFTLTSGSSTYTAQGGPGQFNVDTQLHCTWTASNSQPTWVTMGSAGTTGSGPVTFPVQPNGTQSSRSANITVNNQSHSITQDGLAAPPPPPPPVCTYTLDTTERNVGAIGGIGVVSVATGPTCAWTVSPGANWLRLAGNGTTGSGPVGYVIEPNLTGAPRTTTATIAGQPFTVRQQ